MTFLAALRGYPGRAFLIAFFAYTLSQLDMALFAYATPAIRKEFGITLPQMALVISGGYLAGGAIQVWMANLTDRFGRKTLLMAAVGGSSLFVAAHGLAPGPFALGAARALAIGTGGAIYPATGAIITEEAPARYRGILAGMLQIAYPLGWFLASLLAAPLLMGLGWRVMFMAALLTAPYILVVHFFLRETARFTAEKASRTVRPSLAASIRTMLGPGLRRRTIILFAAQFLFVIAYGGSTFLLPTYFTEHRGLPLGTAAYLVGIGNAVSILGYLLAAYVGEFVLTRRTTAALFTILGSIGFLMMLWLPSGFYDTMALFGLMSIFFYGAAAVKFAFIAEVFPTRYRSTGLAVCGSLAVNLGIATGPLALSTAVGFVGWQLAMSVLVVVPLVSAGLLYLLLTPVPSGIDIDEVQARLAEQG